MIDLILLLFLTVIGIFAAITYVVVTYWQFWLIAVTYPFWGAIVIHFWEKWRYRDLI